MTVFDVLNGLLLLIGLFYVGAAVIVARAARLSAVIDAAIAGLSAGRRDRMDLERSLWLFAVGAVAGLAGMLLLIDSPLAVPVFVVGCAMQALHVLWLSPRRFDLDEPMAPADRARSMRAFALFAAVTAFVVGSTHGGLLKPLDQIPLWAHLAVGTVWLGWVIWVVRDLVRAGSSPVAHPLPPFPDDPEVVVRISPAFNPTCLFNLQTGEPLWDHEAQALFPRALLDQARDYMMLFRRLADPHDPRRLALRDPAHQEILDREGEALEAALLAHRPGRVVLESRQRLEHFPDPFDAIEVTPTLWVNSLWGSTAGEDAPRMLSPDWIGISWALSQDLYAWAEAFDRIHDPKAGERGPLWSPEQSARHAEWGRALARRLFDEFTATGRGGVVVTFRPHGGMAEPVSHLEQATVA